MNMFRKDNGINGVVKHKEVKDECFYEIDETSFYPPLDDRLYSSGISDIFGGDNFEDFAELFWELYEDEIYN